MADPGPIEATNLLCDFIVRRDSGAASDLLLSRARDLIVDTFGVAIAATVDDVAYAAAAIESDGAGGGPVTLLGRGKTQSPGFGAFYNGALAHALEFDDTTLNPVGHPSCIIVPALLALGEKIGINGRAFIDAYLVGLEVHSRLAQAELGGWSSSGSWLPIGHVSLLGAAAACARLLSLDRDQTAHALGLAAHFCGGLSVSNGSLAKPIGSGSSARAGLEAALLAKAGATAAFNVIERNQGFADVYLGQGHDLQKAFAQLGCPHHLEEIGVAIKRYPSCYATHWGVDSLLLLIDEHKLHAQDVQSVVLAHPRSGAFCDNPNPKNTEEARFSHEYNLAAAVLDGVPGPRSFTPNRLAKPDIRAMLNRIQTANHPADLAPPNSWEYRVTLTTASGDTFSKAVPRPLGHPRNPMNRAELQNKFLTCVEGLLDDDNAARLLGLLENMIDLPALTPLTETLSKIKPTHLEQRS